MRRSDVTDPIDSLMISNLPVTTEISYSTSAQNTIHEIGNSPKHAPSTALLTASTGDIL